MNQGFISSSAIISTQKISASPTICDECIFSVQINDLPTCINPDETKIDCTNVIFCSSFQPINEVESPCVCFGEDET
jgi:hypothetical protein